MGVKSSAVITCDRAFSLFIRKRDEDKWGLVKCCTCATRKRVGEMTCGHFMGRGNMSTRWDEENCAPQCYECQGRNNGERKLFAKYLDRRYGEGTAEELRIKSYQPANFHTDEIKELTKKYRSLIK